MAAWRHPARPSWPRIETGSLAQAALDGALGLAVGPRHAGPGAPVLEPGLLAGLAGGTTLTALPFFVITRWAVTPRLTNQASARDGEGSGTLLTVAGQEIGLDEPESIVDADVQVLPGLAPRRPAPVAGDQIIYTVDPAQLLDGDLDELARLLLLIADCRRLGLKGPEPTKPTPAQERAHGRDRPTEAAGDGRAGETLPAQGLDLSRGFLGQAAGAAVRARGAVEKAGLTFRGMPIAPLAYGLQIDLKRRRHGPARSQALDHQLSTMRCRPGILMDVHPLPPRGWCKPGSRILQARSRVDNFHSNGSWT